MAILSKFDKFLVVFLVVIIGVIFVGAGTVSPARPYHQFSQVAVNMESVANDQNQLLPKYGGTGVAGCSDGNILKWKGNADGNWTCGGISVKDVNLPKCIDGNVLKWSGGASGTWVCGDINASNVFVYNSVTNSYSTLQQVVTNYIVGGSDVNKIIAGSNVTISPATGVGEVTINATGTYVQGGLYGHCTAPILQNYPADCSAIEPGYCYASYNPSTGNYYSSCGCRSGFTLVITGSVLLSLIPNEFSCIKN